MGNEDYLVRQSLPTNSDYVFVQVEIAIANASSGKGSRTASISGRTRPNSTICSWYFQDKNRSMIALLVL